MLLLFTSFGWLWCLRSMLDWLLNLLMSKVAVAVFVPVFIPIYFFSVWRSNVSHRRVRLAWLMSSYRRILWNTLAACICKGALSHFFLARIKHGVVLRLFNHSHTVILGYRFILSCKLLSSVDPCIETVLCIPIEVFIDLRLCFVNGSLRRSLFNLLFFLLNNIGSLPPWRILQGPVLQF